MEKLREILDGMLEDFKELNDKPMAIDEKSPWEKQKEWLDSLDHEAMYDKFRDDFVDWIYDHYNCTHEDQAMRYEEDSDVWDDFVDGLDADQIIYLEKKA